MRLGKGQGPVECLQESVHASNADGGTDGGHLLLSWQTYKQTVPL